MTHAIVQPTNLLEAHCIDKLRLEINYKLDNGTKIILLDLCKIKFMNSSSLGILTAILKQVQQHGSELVLCDLNPQVQHIIELTHLDRIFKVCSLRQVIGPIFTSV